MLNTRPTQLRYAVVPVCHNTAFNNLMEAYVAYLAYCDDDCIISAPENSAFWQIADNYYAEYFDSYEVPK